MLIDKEPIKFNDFSNSLWNDLTLNRKLNDDINDIAVEYGKTITTAKKYAIKYGPLGIPIIKEITRICTQHLEFVVKMSKKQYKSNKGSTSSGVYAVCVNPETMGLMCLSCGKPPAAEKKLLKCSRCLLAHYCGADCQNADWKEHKKNCCAKK
jgi:hypothetical protein